MVAAYGGRAAVRLAAGNHEGAITDATAAIAADAEWSFDHGAGINVEDLHLILAQAWFGSGEEQFPQAQAQIDILDPVNGLSPLDPLSWGEAPTYAAALLIHIQEIEERIGAELAL